jgi:hypothetical protein
MMIVFLLFGSLHVVSNLAPRRKKRGAFLFELQGSARGGTLRADTGEQNDD